MCIAFWQTAASDELKFVLASNRDEFLARPTDAARWRDYDTADGGKKVKVLCGVDLTAKGTWLGMTASGRIALLTNFTEPFASRILPDGRPRPSRGDLTMRFLTSDSSVEEYAGTLKAEGLHDYTGFNLLVGTLHNSPQFAVISNRSPEKSESVSIHSGEDLLGGGISNGHFVTSKALADTGSAWEKIKFGCDAFAHDIRSCADRPDELKDALFELLSTPSPTFDTNDPLTTIRSTVSVTPFKFDAPPKDLPASQVPSEQKEPAHRRGHYGTRLQTIIMLDKTNRFKFVERKAWTLKDDEGEPYFDGRSTEFEFSLE